MRTEIGDLEGPLGGEQLPEHHDNVSLLLSPDNRIACL